MTIFPTTDNTVCFVVDIQERLTPALHNHEFFSEKSRQLLQGLQALEVPIALTEQYPKGLGHTIAAIKLLLKDNPVFEKTQFSAWIPEVENFIAEHQAKNVILIGGETHICVLQTAIELRQRGFNVYLPQECLASRTELNKNNGLQQMHDAGAIVTNIESLLFMLLGDAKHTAFKTISKLIQ